MELNIDSQYAGVICRALDLLEAHNNCLPKLTDEIETKIVSDLVMLQLIRGEMEYIRDHPEE